MVQTNTFTYHICGILGRPCPDEPMWKICNSFRERQGSFTLIFIYNNEIIDESKTARELGIPEGETIAHVEPEPELSLQ